MTLSPRTSMVGAAACAAAFASVFVLAYHVPAGRSADGDIVRALTDLNGPGIGTLASAVAHSAVIVIPLALCGLVWSAATRGRRREAVAAAAVVVIALLGAEVLKVALDQPRLRLALGLQEAGANHFPSGHATASTALAFAAFLATPAARKRLALGLGAAYAAAVCASILILGWHLPSDVVGGVLWSSFCFCAIAAALRFRGRRVATAPSGPNVRRE